MNSKTHPWTKKKPGYIAYSGFQNVIKRFGYSYEC